MDLPSFSDDPCYFYWVPDSSGQVYLAKEGNVITKFVADFVQWEHKAGNEFRIEEEKKLKYIQYQHQCWPWCRIYKH